MTQRLQNIKAISEMLRGEHRTQTASTLGWDDSTRKKEMAKIRKIGEEWEEYDKNGKVVCIWVQKDGYRIKKPPSYKIIKELKEYLNSYPNCLPDCSTEVKTRLDERFRAKFGRCADCQFRIENRIKLSGNWRQYEMEQMKQNALAFFEQADKEIKIVAQQLREGVNFANSDGNMEEWSGDVEIANQIESEYEQYKQIVLQKFEEYNEQGND